MGLSSNRLFPTGAITLALGLTLAGLSPGLAQDEATTPAAGEGDPPVAALHPGDCADSEAAPIADLGVLAPYGAAQGQDAATYRGVQTDALPVLSTNVTLDLPFDNVFSEQQPHALAIHQNAASFGTLLACGEVAGAEIDGRVVIGLRPLNESGYAGVAMLDDDDAGFLGLGEDQTQITIYLISDLTTAPQTDAVPADEAEATPVAEDEAATPAEGEATPAEDQEAAPAEDEEADEQAAEDEATGESVTVEAIDIDFNPNQFSIPANTDATVTLTNNGGIQHTFTIDELGIDEALDPGETREITINAEAGDYVYYCSVPGHRQAGQEGTMTVE
jgi:plastocyanin